MTEHEDLLRDLLVERFRLRPAPAPPPRVQAEVTREPRTTTTTTGHQRPAGARPESTQEAS